MIILAVFALVAGALWWVRRRRYQRASGVDPDPSWPDVRRLGTGSPARDGGSSAARRIVLSGLTKHYRSVKAVDDLSFVVEPGRVTGFLGPNGAGKTTTLRMLLDLVSPTAGTATIGGVRYRDLDRPARHVGAVLDASGAHKGRSGRNHLRIICQSTGLPPTRADEVLKLVGLDAAGNRKVKEYSLGMRQRLAIAAALIGDPPVLVLDEPVNGLDPEGIRWVRDLLKALAADGRTILISSHLLAEMQLLADDLIIIAAGRLAAQGTVAAVVDSIALSGRIRVQSSDVGKLVAALDHPATVTGGAEGEVYVTGVDAATIGDAAQRAGVAVHQLTTERPDLEAVFLELTKGKAAIR